MGNCLRDKNLGGIVLWGISKGAIVREAVVQGGFIGVIV